ncbi:protein disulfide-isomerase-like isoform X3 [Stegostoma tigrinum]|uniref:protein disulfide-isomerase-like isoform X3 n=1 Tax=Stegostoma tigrinum TaxID=3053191 RepID=UPI00202B991D|nr:protein disulfide-isomerase-like isoform X3 [Stegostoma tigrinum]
MQKVKKPKIKEDQSVLVLNKDNFDRALKESKFLLVNFYAPLSGASLTLLTEFEKAAVQLKSEKQVKLSKVDVSTEKDLAKEFGIQDYPVLKLFIRGERKNPLNCTGVSSASSIATWLRRRIGPSATRLLNITHIETFIASEDVVVVGFFKFEEERLDFKIANGSSLEKDDLTKFIKVNELSLVTEYNQMTSSKIFNVGIDSHLLLFVDKTAREFNEIYENFKAAAADLRAQIIFILVDTDESMNGRLREFFQIRDMDVPAVCLINTTEDVRYRMRADQVTTESVKKFCQDYLNGKEKPQQYSEDLPEDWNKNPVKVLVGSNFDEFVFNTSKSVFVLFCAPWSERCKHINSIWDQLGEKYKDSENIVIAKVDITANDIDSVIIEEYPSVKYFPPGSDRKIVHYTSAQTLNAFSKFLDKQGKSKVRISTMPATVHFI